MKEIYVSERQLELLLGRFMILYFNVTCVLLHMSCKRIGGKLFSNFFFLWESHENHAYTSMIRGMIL